MTEQCLKRWSGLLVLVGLLLVACGPVAPAAAGDQPRPAMGQSGPDPTPPQRHQGTPIPAGAGPIDPWSLAPDTAGRPDPPLSTEEIGRRLAAGWAQGGDGRGTVPAIKVEVAWSTAGTPTSPRLPIALARDGQGHLIVLDAAPHRVLVFDTAGQLLHGWGSAGSDIGQFHFHAVDRCQTPDDPSCAKNLGGGVAVDGEGHIYVADYGNHRIQIFDSAGRPVGGWGRAGSGPGEFQLPSAIAVSEQGHVYVSDTGNRRIQKFDRTGQFLTTWGNFSAASGLFIVPGALAIDGQGRVHVVDPWHNRIQQFDGQGRLLRPWAPEGGAGWTGTASALALDRQGQLYVTGATIGVQKLTDTGREVACWGGGGAWDIAVRQPSGIAVDEAGGIYLVDRDAGRLLKVRQLLPTTS